MTTLFLEVPKWVLIIRGLQLLLAVIVLGISAYGVYWIAFNSWGFAIFTSLATFIVVLYGILTARIASWHKAYNYWAVVALDALLVVFWLSAMGALAATRAIFVIPTTLNGCYNNGSIGGGVCYKKRALDKRGYVATNSYLSMMSGAAGISAILFILFVVTLVMNSMALHRHRKAGQADAAVTNDKVEEGYPMANVQQQQPQYTGAPAQYEQPPVQYQQQPTQYQQPPTQYQQPAPPQQY